MTTPTSDDSGVRADHATLVGGGWRAHSTPEPDMPPPDKTPEPTPVPEEDPLADPVPVKEPVPPQAPIKAA